MKMERHSKIVELIGKYEIETQEELAEYLNKEGYNVTQATVSRDIRELPLPIYWKYSANCLFHLIWIVKLRKATRKLIRLFTLK